MVNLRYEAVEDPQPGPDQVRIAVAAAGVHLIDTTIRSGQQFGPCPPPELPTTPRREVAGGGRRGGSRRRRRGNPAVAGRYTSLEDQAFAAAASGALVPLVGPTFPLTRAADVHRALETRASVGKTVLTP